MRVIEDTAQAHAPTTAAARRGDRRRRLLLLSYPTKNPRRLGRRRRDRHQRRADRRTRAPAPLPRRVQPRYHHRIVGTDRAPRRAAGVGAADQALRRLDDRNADRRRLGRAAARGACRRRASSCRRPRSRAPTTSTTCSWSARRAATRCGRIWRTTASRPPSTTRSRSTARRPTGRSPPEPFPPRNGSHGRSATLPLFPDGRRRRRPRDRMRSSPSRPRSKPGWPAGSSQPTPLRSGTAVVGYGYWGPNLVRNVMERARARIRRPVRARPRARWPRSRRVRRPAAVTVTRRRPTPTMSRRAARRDAAADASRRS